jgi:hypothetical protein
VPKALKWWCRALMMLAVEEHSKPEFKVCLGLAKSMGMDLDNLVASIPGRAMEALKRAPVRQQRRNEHEALEIPYARPAMPVLDRFVEAYANSADPSIASVTLSIRAGKRCGTCNVRFVELFLTTRSLDGFATNGLAKAWYELIIPEDMRRFSHVSGLID